VPLDCHALIGYNWLNEPRGIFVAELESQQGTQAEPAALAMHPFDEDVDETLVDLLLEQTISDRLRSLGGYVNTLAKFRPV
jgi:hypothetical protein